MQGDEVVAQKRSPPLALAACDEDGFTRLVGERIESTLHREVTGAPLSPTRTRIGQDIGPHSSPVGSCGCAHERRSTASRACTMAATSLATSGRVASSRTKFGKLLPHSSKSWSPRLSSICCGACRVLPPASQTFPLWLGCTFRCSRRTVSHLFAEFRP